MMEARDLAVKILDEARAQIQANMAQHYRTSNGERWINASGRSSAAFQVVEEDGHVRLVYRGEDVAPYDTLEEGTTGIPPISVIEDWQREKGVLTDVSPWAIRTNMKKRGGSERHIEPQDWVIKPVVDLAVKALNEQLPDAYIRDITQMMSENLK